MSMTLSQNTQAILLLAAPLIAGRGESSSDPLTLGEYKRLTRILRDKQRQPADLLSSDAEELLYECQQVFDGDRLTRLLGRGFLLSQVVERWQARAIWVISRADAGYPRRLKTRLGEDAPPVLYGCGDAAILDTGGLAVVGSRHVDDALVSYTESIGRLAATARCTLVSGGARGIDQAAMRSALAAGGKVTGVLADSLERAVLSREHRGLLTNGQLVLISPYDPAAGFNVGHAMQRNKLIYALADAALVVSSDYEKGGTWAGAVEQLDKFRFVPIYIRSNGETEKGLESLGKKGAMRWPDSMTPETLAETLAAAPSADTQVPRQRCLSFDEPSGPKEKSVDDQLKHSAVKTSASTKSVVIDSSPAEELFGKVRELLTRMDTAKTESEIAEELQVSKGQAREWLQRLVDEGVLEKLSRPNRYRPVSSLEPLFDSRE
ncbi:MAG: DNA-processing protein DprA [Sedimentisphaerales bacterium]|nr:DNA-processing protein DprA [Sedimentisphaerales bacterium]